MPDNELGGLGDGLGDGLIGSITLLELDYATITASIYGDGITATAWIDPAGDDIQEGGGI